MSKILHNYSLKLPQETMIRQQVDWLKHLCLQASLQLLDRLWTIKWIEALASSKKKAYTVIREQQVQLTINGNIIYFPSRIQRCIAEQVGRIIRSQRKHINCYYDVLKVVQFIGVEGNLNRLVRLVGLTLSRLYGKYYRWAMIRQTLRTFRRFYYKLGLDLEVFTKIPYTQLVKPRIYNFILPYAADDGNAIKTKRQEDCIFAQMKLPNTKCPINKRDWSWVSFTLKIPFKILQRLHSDNTKLHRPTLRYFTLKGLSTVM